MKSSKGDRAKNRRRNFLAKQTRESKIFREKAIPDKRSGYKRKDWKFSSDDQDGDDIVEDPGGCPYGALVCCKSYPSECECVQYSDWTEELQNKS